MSTNNAFALNTDRLIDEMALALLGIAELGSDEACIRALMMAGFSGKDIGHYLDEARDLARAAVDAIT
jgi:hypothetical protein